MQPLQASGQIIYDLPVREHFQLMFGFGQTNGCTRWCLHDQLEKCFLLIEGAVPFGEVMPLRAGDYKQGICPPLSVTTFI